MGLAQVQRLLARLYTDAQVREQFFAAPREVSDTFGLTSDESSRLAQISAKQLDFFAASLRRKRRSGVAKLLPHARQALGERFNAVFGLHAAAYVPTGRRKHREDALAFCAFIERAAQAGELEPPWLADLARFEAAMMRSAERRLTVCVVRYAVPALLRRSEGEAVIPPAVRPTLVIWLRGSRRTRPRQLLQPLPTQLFERSD